MKINNKLVERIADLARLKVKKEEMESVKKDLQGILDFMSVLNEVDTNNVPPVTRFNQYNENTLREDEITPSLNTKEILNNSPDVKNGFYKVPKVVSKKA